jgi:hypothetical protein
MNLGNIILFMIQDGGYRALSSLNLALNNNLKDILNLYNGIYKTNRFLNGTKNQMQHLFLICMKNGG